jgi:hypothetical protein
MTTETMPDTEARDAALFAVTLHVTPRLIEHYNSLPNNTFEPMNVDDVTYIHGGDGNNVLVMDSRHGIPIGSFGDRGLMFVGKMPTAEERKKLAAAYETI